MAHNQNIVNQSHLDGGELLADAATTAMVDQFAYSEHKVV